MMTYYYFTYLLLLFLLPLISCSPKFYISYHGGSGGINTIYSYDFNGSLITNNVLMGDSNADEYRSLLLMDDSTIMVANANKDLSHISQFSLCNINNNNIRTFIHDFIPDNTTTLQHPYGIVYGYDGTTLDWTLYVSNQDDNSVTSYNKNGEYIHLIYNFDNSNIRSLAYDQQNFILYIACTTDDTVYAYDTTTQYFNSTLKLSVSKPIGLYLDNNKRILYIGSNSNNKPSVYAFNIDTQKIIQKYHTSTLGHPAGMVVSNNILYVLSQDSQSLIMFDTGSGNYIDTLIHNMPDVPEQIMISPC